MRKRFTVRAGLLAVVAILILTVVVPVGLADIERPASCGYCDGENGCIVVGVTQTQYYVCRQATVSEIAYFLAWGGPKEPYGLFLPDGLSIDIRGIPGWIIEYLGLILPEGIIIDVRGECRWPDELHCQ